MSGECRWSQAPWGSIEAILRRAETELSLDVKYEAVSWTGILRASSTGLFTGILTSPTDLAEPAKLSGFLYRKVSSNESELIFAGRWLEGSDDYNVWITLLPWD